METGAQSSSFDYPVVDYRMPARDESEMLSRAEAFLAEMQARRSVRHFSPRPVARRLIELAIRTAASAPSGANRQPWKFVAVSDPDIKSRIREAAENEEREFYSSRASEEWLQALAPLGTDWSKPFLEIAPWLVVVFAESYEDQGAGGRTKNYYVQESVGLACGLFIAALHHMGLATLTHTPSPMGFLSKILGRPKNERPYILFPIGYPADDARVPDIHRKDLEDVLIWKPPQAPNADSRELP